MNYGKKAAKRRETQMNAKGKKIRNKFGVTIGKVLLVCILFLGAVGISSGIGVWKGIIDSAPDISAMDVTPTGYSTTVLSSDEQEIATLVASGANRKYVTLDDIPVDMQHAFVAIEDARFYKHNGIDITGIVRAFVDGLRSGGHFSQGASTITQQLIKNNVLTSWTGETTFIESLQRKIQEQYLAVQLEKQVQNKDWILENYLNTINLGSNTLGVQAASLRYFGKDVSELTLSESAVIAGITQYPNKYNPITHPENNAERRKKVLNEMKEQGYITQAQYEEAMADNVYDRIAEHDATTEDNSVNSYFTDALIDDVLDDLVNELGYTESEAYKALYQGGLTIYSTQDPAIQQICDEEANNLDNYPSKPVYSFNLAFQVKKADGSTQNYTNQTMLSYYKKVLNNQEFSINYPTEEECYNAIHQYEQDVLEEGDSLVEGSESIYITLQPQVALTVIDQETGEVKALVGGRGNKVGNRTWNRATKTVRQPGSTFKIIGAYAPALDAGGLTLASVQDDAPFTVGSKTYRNYDGVFRGFTTVRQAITNSINIVTVKTLDEIGVDLGYSYAESFGFTTLDENDKNLGLALGGLTKGVKNIELTAAYAAIANKGVYMEPKFYTKVLDHEGNVLLDKEDTQETHRVIRESTAWLLTDAMKDVMTSGTGTLAYFGGSMAQAGKSGTTTSNRDCLWAGFTPYYTCVVWGGNDDNSIQSGKRTSYPKNIWRQIMKRLHADLPSKDFEMPDDIVTASVCRKSGLLPCESVCDLDPRGSQVITEYFAEASLPTETCDHHIAYDICNASGMIANEYCPADQVTHTVFITGGSEGTGDTPYLASEEFAGQVCTLHNSTPSVPDIPDTNTNNPVPPESDPDEPSEGGSETDPNNGDSGSDSGEGGGTASPSSAL